MRGSPVQCIFGGLVFLLLLIKVVFLIPECPTIIKNTLPLCHLSLSKYTKHQQQSLSKVTNMN